ncbi:glycosyltransferase family 2 protein [Enterocloster aldenensis]|uniref:glycosyltransferase family 2 protein n=1 Tax=Enterocloster aldenensis TaxID=358742 RepID=UPI004027EAAA
MNNGIKVSVIIPTYNRCGTILKSVESVLGQSYEDLECIIVDDGSDDGTEDIIRGIKDERIIYIKNNLRLGAAKSRNIGYGYATGSVIGFNDSDDIWNKHKLSMQLEVLNQDTNYGMVYCPYLYSTGDIIRRMPSYDIPVKLLSGRMFDFLLEGNVIGTPTMLIKKSCFMELGGFDESLKALEDYDLALRISQKCEIGFVDVCLVNAYHVDKGVDSHYLNALDACFKILDKFKCGSKKNGLYSLILKYIPLIKDCTIKEQMVKCIQIDSLSGKVYLNYAFEMSERWTQQKEKEQMLISLIDKADYTDIWNKLFHEMNIRNVAIYGCGSFGQVLSKQFAKCNVHFWGMIDRKVTEYEGTSVYKTTNIPNEIDAIIITVYSSSLNTEELAKKTKAKILHLDEVLSLL